MVICSTNERRPGSLPFPWVAVVPTAVHPTPATHDTEFKRSIGPTVGLGSIDQDEPFQYSMKAWGWNPLPPPPPKLP